MTEKRMAFDTEDPEFRWFKKLLVDSADWAAVEGLTLFGYPVKANPSGDVWEARLPGWRREQYFTCAAAIRETRAAGAELPNARELEAAFFEDVWRLDTMAAYTLRRSASGFRHCVSGAFYDQGATCCRWTADTMKGKGNRFAVVAGRTGAKRMARSPRDAFPVSVTIW